MNIDVLESDLPIEAARAVWLIGKYKEEKSQVAAPNSYNLYLLSKRRMSPQALQRHFVCAEKRDLVKQVDYYRESPTYTLTPLGREVYQELLGLNFYV